MLVAFGNPAPAVRRIANASDRSQAQKPIAWLVHDRRDSPQSSMVAAVEDPPDPRAEWDRVDWFSGVEQIGAVGFTGSPADCLRLLDQWTYRVVPPSSLWNNFVSLLRHTPGDPIRPSPWRTLRAALRTLLAAKRERDAEALVKTVHRLGFLGGSSIFSLDDDDREDAENFVELARMCFAFYCATEPTLANSIAEDAKEALSRLGRPDRAKELGEWIATSEVHWNKLSDRDREILEVLATKGQLRGPDIAAEMRGKDGQKLTANAIKNRLNKLKSDGILDRGPEGFWIKSWPRGTPISLLAMRTPQ